MASLGLLLIFISAVLTFLLALPEKALIHDIQASSVSLAMTNIHETAFSWHWLKSLLPTQILFPVLLRIWLAGVLLLSIKMLVNYIKALHLKNHKVFALNHRHFALAQALIKRFKISRKVIFRESALVDSPSLIGYFKPVVLLPISLLSGIPDNQLEIIIAHELAHIRRHDYLVQFIQGIIEILFFYHPVVWWLSSVVNSEREHICDDLAVKVCGESLTLIKALNNMESIRKKQPELVLNFSGKKANLLHRVRRILNPQVVTHPKLERSLLSAVFVFALSGLILFSNLANSKNQVKVETQNSTSLSIGDSDNNRLGQAAAINLAPQKKKKQTKKKIVVAPAVAIVSEAPEAPELLVKVIAITDTIREKEIEEVIEMTVKIDSSAPIYISAPKISFNSDKADAPLCILDGAEISQLAMKKLDPESIESISVLKDEASLSIYGIKDKDGVILISTKKNKVVEKKLKKNKAIKFKGKTKNPPLYIIDGSNMDANMNLNDIDPDDIESINVLKGESALALYGKTAKNGVVLITTKKDQVKKKISKKNKAFKIKVGKNTSTSPVYIIDGIKTTNSQNLKSIDPDDIESINVYKGEKALEVYGPEATDGVIVIKTKKKQIKTLKFNDYIESN